MSLPEDEAPQSASAPTATTEAATDPLVPPSDHDGLPAAASAALPTPGPAQPKRAPLTFFTLSSELAEAES